MPEQYVVITLSQVVALIFMIGVATGLLAHRAIKDLVQAFKWRRKRYTDYDVLLEPHKVRMPKDAVQRR